MQLLLFAARHYHLYSFECLLLLSLFIFSVAFSHSWQGDFSLIFCWLLFHFLSRDEEFHSKHSASRNFSFCRLEKKFAVDILRKLEEHRIKTKCLCKEKRWNNIPIRTTVTKCLPEYIIFKLKYSKNVEIDFSMPTFSNNTLFKKHKNEIPLSAFDESNENKRHLIVVFPD